MPELAKAQASTWEESKALPRKPAALSSANETPAASKDLALKPAALSSLGVYPAASNCAAVHPRHLSSNALTPASLAFFNSFKSQRFLFFSANSGALKSFKLAEPPLTIVGTELPPVLMAIFAFSVFCVDCRSAYSDELSAMPGID